MLICAEEGHTDTGESVSGWLVDLWLWFSSENVRVVGTRRCESRVE